MKRFLSAVILLGVSIFGIPARPQIIDTTCVNLQALNTGSNEYLPFLVNSLLFFTSDRKNTLEGQTLEFTEKVYWSAKKNGQWQAARKDGYKWNSDNNTAMVGVGPKNFYFYRSYWKNNGEIFLAPRKADTSASWKAKPLQKFDRICSDFNETCVTTDNEDTFYFVSNRNGNYDIFMQTGKDEPVSVDILNSSASEQDVFITPNGRNIFFSSDRPGGKGGYDVYESDKVNSQWTSPVRLQSKYINTESDDRDFRRYNDSTMFLSSNRGGGSGAFDLYEINTHYKDTVKRKEDTLIVVVLPDSIKTDTIKIMHDQLVIKLQKLGLFPIHAELQLGAYRYIKSVKRFKNTFICIENEDLRADTQHVEGKILYKYIINKVYTDIDEAITAQSNIISRNCLPDKDFIDMPFIALLKTDGTRYAIFWKQDEYDKKNVFYIYSDGKPVWKGKRF